MSVIKVLRDLNGLFNYSTDENPTSQQDYQKAVKNWVKTIVSLVDSNLWQPETEYTVGSQLLTPSLPYYVLRCTVAGTSGAAEPDYTDVALGDKITDGTVTWVVDGYLPLSGGTINGDLSFTGSNRKITFNNGKSHVVGFGNGVYMYGDTANKQSSFIAFTNENGNGFQVNAGDGTTQSRLVGKPDGTLTWNSQPLLPVGIVQAFAGTTIPSGWLLCDGSAVSRTTYASLYACIGTTYGAGDGSTTFNLPNLVDKFVEGSATAGTVKSAGLPNITGGDLSFRPIDGGMNVTWDGGTGAIKIVAQTGNESFCVAKGSSKGPRMDVAIDASWSNPIYGNSNTVQPPALTMRYIIKY